MTKKPIAGLSLILFAGLLVSPRPAGATDLRPPRIIVGNGTPDSCTEIALQDAVTTARLSGGGIIKFQCGADPVTIVLSVQSPLESGYMVTLNLPDNTTIDGEDRVSLASTGHGDGSFIYVDPAVTVILKNLSLQFGIITSFSRVIWNTGSLTLQNVTVTAPSSGREIVNDGRLRVRNSTMFGNRASGGNALGLVILENRETGTLVVSDTVFSDNNGHGIFNTGTATIDSSSFLRMFLDVSGPAISNSGTLVVRGTRFSNNGSRSGGAVRNSGTLVLKDSTFSDNSASMYGGGLYNSGTATIENSQFSGNRIIGSLYGGGAIFNTGTLNVRNSDFTGNHAGPTSEPSSEAYGGALYNASSGALTIKFSTLSGNTADFGGAIANGGLPGNGLNQPSAFPNGGTLRIGNSVIINNAARQLGGGIYNHGTGTVRLDLDTQVTDNTPDDIFP